MAKTQTQETAVETKTKTKTKTEVKITAPQREKLVSFTKWADKFRYLSAEGYGTKHIATITGKRYQQVRNTLIVPTKKR